MDLAALLAARLAAHRLTAPADDVVAAARHMTATQAQEFAAARWALAIRSHGAPTMDDVDAAFERGDLVRSWTQRGTVHILDPRDLGWLLRITRERQDRQAAGTHRAYGIDDDLLARAERIARGALAGGERLTRGEFAEVLAGAGIDPAGMRANLVLTALCRREVIVLGPVVPREGAPTRDQYLVAAEEWIPTALSPSDPLAEMLVRYLRAHGPAGLDDFRWWAGLPVGLARAALSGAEGRVDEIEEGLFVERAPTPAAPDDRRAGVLALPAFDEYYLSYADRTTSCDPALAAEIGPSANGAVQPVLVDASGVVVGTWKHSLAVGRHHLDPVAEIARPGVGEASVLAALERYRAFLG